MNFKLEKRTLLLWQIRIGAVAAAVAAAVLLLLPFGIYTAVLPTVAIVVIAAVAVFWYVPALFKSYNIFVGQNSVVVTRGVFVRTTHIMPFKRLVFAGCYSSPFSRILHLKGVTLSAARGKLRIPEMDASAADRLIMGLSGGQSND